MTNPEPLDVRPPATAPATAGRTAAAAAMTLLALSLLGGCGEEPEPVAVAPRKTAPPPPPPPSFTPIDQLMVTHGFDERIILPEELAPDNDPDRIAVLEFFDAFARGDAESLGLLLSEIDRRELDALVKLPAWEQTVEDITQIRLETGKAPFGEKAVLAIFEVGNDYQPQLWYYGQDTGDYAFEAVATPPDMMSRLHGDDFIKLWHEILEEELAYANRQDEEFEITPVTIDGGSTGSSGGGTPPAVQPDRPSPTGPGAPPGRRKAPPKRRPPGPGGG